MPEKKMVRFTEGDQVSHIKFKHRVVLKGEYVVRGESFMRSAYSADVEVSEVCSSYLGPIG